MGERLLFDKSNAIMYFMFLFFFYVSNILWFGFRCILHCSISLYGTEDLSRKQQHQREKKLTHVFGGKWQISPSYETAFATISSHLEISSLKKHTMLS